MIERSLEFLLSASNALTAGDEGTVVESHGFYAHPSRLALIASLLGEKFCRSAVEVIVSPDTQSFALLPGIAQYLMASTDREIYIASATSMANSHYFIPPYYRQFVAGRSVLVIDDVITVGSRARRVCDAVRQTGGHVAAIGTVYDASGRFEVTFADIPVRGKLLSRSSVSPATT